MLKVKVRYPTPNLAKTRKANHEYMVNFVRESLETWVIETSTPVPVWSGAARATFLFLAAQAFTSIQINPVVESRISLGLSETDAEVFLKQGDVYGWRWQTDLIHMPIVEDRVGFIEKGLRSIRNKKPILPPPVTKPLKG